MMDTYQSWLNEWAQIWNLPELPQGIRIEFSTRMSRSLGRCHVSSGLIRLNQRLLAGPEELLREILCHEAAHVAVYLLHGNSRRPHGPEWAQFMTAAGYEPHVRMPMNRLPESIQAGAAPRRSRKRKGRVFQRGALAKFILRLSRSP